MNRQYKSAAAEALALTALLFKQGHWTQYAYARDCLGKPVAVSDPRASSWSLSGGLALCCRFVTRSRHIPERRLLSVIIDQLDDDAFRWSEEPERTAEQVIRLCDRAARQLNRLYNYRFYPAASRILRSTVSLFETAEWSEKTLASDSSGVSISVLSPTACRFSLRGALTRLSYTSEVREPALLVQFTEMYLARTAGVRSIRKWCSAPNRQLSDLTSLCLATADRLEKGARQ